MQSEFPRPSRNLSFVLQGKRTPRYGMPISRIRTKLNSLIIPIVCLSSLLLHYLIVSSFNDTHHRPLQNSLRNHVKQLQIPVNHTSRRESSAAIHRDGSLSDLVRLMNSDSMIRVFKQWDHTPDMDRFLELLSPWIVKGEVSIKNATRPHIPLDCAQARYSPVLTGRPLSGKNKTHFIVDFVMFGYDVEKLLLKFYETYDDVDVFVVYESPYTLMGTRKPLYFEQLKRESRFSRFLDKVVHIVSREEDIRASVNATRAAFARGERGCSGEVSVADEIPEYSLLLLLLLCFYFTSDVHIIVIFIVCGHEDIIVRSHEGSLHTPS
jgi:Glycosyltransferase family 17